MQIRLSNVVVSVQDFFSCVLLVMMITIVKFLTKLNDMKVRNTR